MPSSASDRLIERTRPFKKHRYGLGLQDVAAIPVDLDTINDIQECLGSADVDELRWGLFFSLGLLHGKRQIDDALTRNLIRGLPEWLKHRDARIRSAAIPILFELRNAVPNFAQQMVESLTDTDAEVREFALRNAHLFINRKDIHRLLPFRTDPYAAETELGGPLIYVLRNLALEQIENILRKRFPKSELSELDNHEVRFWWDWEPFLAWWSKQKAQ